MEWDEGLDWYDGACLAYDLGKVEMLGKSSEDSAMISWLWLEAFLFFEIYVSRGRAWGGDTREG